jgi:hypothetical protein
MLAQFKEKGFVGDVLFGSFERQIRKDGGHPAQVEAL